MEHIQIFDIQTNDLRTMDTEGWGIIENLAWSPDGEWIAYSRPKDDSFFSPTLTFLIPATGGQSRLVSELRYVAFWISVPHSFQAGAVYSITPAGISLNLRAASSLDAPIIQKLQPGDLVTIVTGPVRSDGYVWWQLRTKAGVEGWAVHIPEWYAPVGGMATPTPGP
jgi:hypothetical protein